MAEDLGKYSYEEISNKVLQVDRRLFDDGSNNARFEDTNPHSLKGVISSKDFGSNIKTNRAEDDKGKEELKNEIQTTLAAFEVSDRKNLKQKSKTSSTARSLESLLDAGSIEALNYTPTTESTMHTYDEIIAWSNEKLDSDLPDDVIISFTDIIIEILKNENSNSLEKKKQLETALKQKIDDDDFRLVYSLCGKLIDYKQVLDVPDKDNDELDIQLDSDDENAEDGIEVTDSENDDDGSISSDVNDEQRDDSIFINQETDNPDDIVRLSLNDDQIPALSIDEVDKYWITKQLAKYQAQIDNYKHAEISKSIYRILEQLVEKRENLKSFMHRLLEIPDFEINDLYYLLVKNYKVIYYGIKLASTEDKAEKDNIRALCSDLNSNKRTLSTVEADDQVLNREKRQKTLTEGKIASNYDNKYPRNLNLKNLVFTQGSKLMTVSKFKLPEGSFKRTKPSWEEINIPPPVKSQMGEDEVLVEISELPEWIQPVFPSTEISTLNRIQSKVFPVAFNSDDNLLMCAPTGAGKTNVAMLTVLRTLSNYRTTGGKFQLSRFKIVYIAPLKALVQEQVREFDRRLSKYGITVNELTGDSNLTKHQIESTQILVTTPEKWDVITRKNNDASYINLVKLVIIDEIHLLHDERGPVLESIVARTMKNIDESRENSVRFVGLSATLPNYKDVAQFLRVEPSGLFYFDASYRPCPLAQQFIGITEKKAFKKYEAMNEICYEKIVENISEGNQVIIFVHSRKETIKTAKWLVNRLVEEDKLSTLFKFSKGVREILRSEAENARNKGLKEVLLSGFGIHHAGMNRDDRQTAEDLFAEGHIKVLVSTATLAWGVNLPAHTVVIKGTSVYSPEKGTWVDLSPQDILQMLGRAGRPRYDTHGDGIIITSQDQVKYYLAVLNQQLPIESQMYAKLADSINAEIVAGSIRSLKDCIDWMGHTYLYVRMLHSREVYYVGPQYDNDPELVERRKDLGYSAFLLLAKNGLVKYNFERDMVIPTSLGRIASHYYISYENMQNFESQLKPTLTKIELFRIFATSEEFKYIPVRREEKLELQKLLEKAPIPVNEDVEDPLSKINILLQAYISGLRLDGFALMADMIFISQSAGRLFRALYDLSLDKKWSKLTRVLLSVCKMVENRMWPTSTPLRQFPNIPSTIVDSVERTLIPWKQYLSINDPQTATKSLGAERFGNLGWELLQKFPKVHIDYNLQPITASLVQIELLVTPNWKWDVQAHGYIETFVLLVDDCDGKRILYNDKFSVRKDYINQIHRVTFSVPVSENLEPNYFVSLISEKWIGCESRIPVMLTKMILPKKFPAPTPLINLDLIPVSELGIKEFTSVFSFDYFNKFQSQAFDSIYNSTDNVLFSCSKGNGKTTLALLAILNHWRNEGGRAVYLNPHQSVVDNLLKHWKKKLSKLAGGKIINKLTGDINIDLQILAQSHLVLATPSDFEIISRRWQQRKSLQSIELLIADDIHTIGSGKEGVSYELVISRFRYIATNLEKNIRFVLLGASIASYRDIMDWVSIPKTNVFVFDARERIYPVQVKFHYMDIHHNPSLFKCLIKPAYNHIANLTAIKGDSTCLAFVPQRSDVLDLAKEFLRKVRTDESNWLSGGEDEVQPYIDRVSDSTLKLCIRFGIGFYFEGMDTMEQTIVFSLFEAGILKVMITTKSSSCVCPSANSVIILGTKEYDAKEHGYYDYRINDILDMIGLARRDNGTDATAIVYTNSSKLEFYKRFITLSLPFESHLNNFINDVFISDISIIKNRQYALDWIAYSLFYRRLQLNPSFYKLDDASEDGLSGYLSELVENSLSKLQEANLVELNLEDDKNSMEAEEEEEYEKEEITPTENGVISNYYNVDYATMEVFNNLNENMRLKKILEFLSLAAEFDSLPIRSGESNLLFKLYNGVPLKWTLDVDFESPKFKTFILLQAYFSGFHLNADLKKDLEYILPTANRLLNAIVDILSSHGHLNALVAMDLCQMISQGIWNTDNVLKQIPHFNDELIAKCKTYNVDTIYDLMELEDKDREDLLSELNQQEIIKVAEFVNKYPNLEVAYKIEGDVVAGESKTIEIEISRDEEVEDLSIASNAFPKKKFESWWIVMGNPKTNELYSIKKLAITKENQTIKLNFAIPEAGEHDLYIWCICDSYLEADKQIEIKGLQVKE